MWPNVSSIEPHLRQFTLGCRRNLLNATGFPNVFEGILNAVRKSVVFSSSSRKNQLLPRELSLNTAVADPETCYSFTASAFFFEFSWKVSKFWAEGIGRLIRSKLAIYRSPVSRPPSITKPRITGSFARRNLACPSSSCVTSRTPPLLLQSFCYHAYRQVQNFLNSLMTRESKIEGKKKFFLTS